MQSRNINQVLKELLNSGTVPQIPGTETYDLYPTLRGLFSDKAKVAMNNKTSHHVYQYNKRIDAQNVYYLLNKLGIVTCGGYSYSYNEGETWVRMADIVNLIAVTCNDNQLADALNKVIDTVNEVAALGYTRAAIAPIAVVKLHVSSIHPKVKYAVMSHITLSGAGEQWLKENKPNLACKEGAVPKSLEEQL